MFKPVVVNDFYALTRHLLGMAWQDRYPGRKLTASGLKDALRMHLTHADEPQCSFIRKFIGHNNNGTIDDSLLINKSKCIENFFQGRTCVPQAHTLEFIVHFFNLEYKSFDEYTRARCNDSLTPTPMVELPALSVDPADMQGFLRVCALISKSLPKSSAL